WAWKLSPYSSCWARMSAPCHPPHGTIYAADFGKPNMASRRPSASGSEAQTSKPAIRPIAYATKLSARLKLAAPLCATFHPSAQALQADHPAARERGSPALVRGSSLCGGLLVT